MLWKRHRTYATLLFLGAGLLLYRTIEMLSSGALETLVWWVSALLLMELIIDAGTMLACLRWGITLRTEHAAQVFYATAAVVIVHATRVLIFVLGRTGPWVDMDVRPEAQLLHAARWTWGEVWFAGTLSAISVLVLVAVWLTRKR